MAGGIETCTPLIRKYRYNQFSGARTTVIAPFFPGYIFARLIREQWHRVHFTRGVHSIVCFGGTPAPVDDVIMATLKARIGEDGCVMTGEELKVGDAVIIDEGPLREFKGIFEREVSAADRVVILLEAVNYQVHLEIERASLRKVG
jgi:transcriptional antiterminator RfaH